MIELTGQEWRRTSSGLYLPRAPRKPVAVDLFCGCGGFSLGLIEAGWDVLCGVDNDIDASQTYMRNLGTYPMDLRFVEPSDRERMERSLRRQMRRNEKRTGVASFSVSGSANPRVHDGVPVFWLGDIRKLTGKQILDSIGLEVGELDLVVGGPPCQGYSMAGKRNVMDPRNSLVFEFARLVCEMRPRVLCMENVPGMASMVTETGQPVLDAICEILEAGDYGTHEAMRAVLAGGQGRKMVSRDAGKRRERPKSPKMAAPEASQLGLFDAVAAGGED